MECIQDPKSLKENIRELYKCYVQPSDVVRLRHWGYYSYSDCFDLHWSVLVWCLTVGRESEGAHRYPEGKQQTEGALWEDYLYSEEPA